MNPRELFQAGKLADAIQALVAEVRSNPTDLRRRSFLFDQLLSEMDLALQQASPSVTKPVHAHGAWACVGVSGSVQWGDPIWAGPYGTGHVFMYEFPATGLSRKDRKAVQAAIDQLERGVSSLSRNQRFELARAASHR